MKKRVCKAIRLCRWCGRLNTLHDVNRGCSVTPAMRRALVDYAREHGRTWRSQLSMLWDTVATWTRDEFEVRNWRRVR